MLLRGYDRVMTGLWQPSHPLPDPVDRRASRHVVALVDRTARDERQALDVAERGADVGRRRRGRGVGRHAGIASSSAWICSSLIVSIRCLNAPGPASRNARTQRLHRGERRVTM